MVSVSIATAHPRSSSSGRSRVCRRIFIDGFRDTAALRPMVPRRRLELPRPCGHRYLKPARLPIPPPGHRRGLAILARGGWKSTGFSRLSSGFAHALYALYRRRRLALHRSEVRSRAAGAEPISWLQNSPPFLGALVSLGVTWSGVLPRPAGGYGFPPATPIRRCS